MTKRKYAACAGNYGDIFNVAPATIQTVRKGKGLLPNEFALSIVYYTNVNKKEMRNVIRKEGYLSEEEAEKDRSLFDLGFRIDKLVSWQRIAERRENSPNIAFKGYQGQLAAAFSAAATVTATAPVAASVIAAPVAVLDLVAAAVANTTTPKPPVRNYPTFATSLSTPRIRKLHKLKQKLCNEFARLQSLYSSSTTPTEQEFLRMSDEERSRYERRVNRAVLYRDARHDQVKLPTTGSSEKRRKKISDLEHVTVGTVRSRIDANKKMHKDLLEALYAKRRKGGPPIASLLLFPEFEGDDIMDVDDPLATQKITCCDIIYVEPEVKKYTKKGVEIKPRNLKDEEVLISRIKLPLFSAIDDDPHGQGIDPDGDVDTIAVGTAVYVKGSQANSSEYRRGFVIRVFRTLSSVLTEKQLHHVTLQAKTTADYLCMEIESDQKELEMLEETIEGAKDNTADELPGWLGDREELRSNFQKENSPSILAQRVHDSFHGISLAPSVKTILLWKNSFLETKGHFQADMRGFRQHECFLKRHGLSANFLLWMQSSKRLSCAMAAEYLHRAITTASQRTVVTAENRAALEASGEMYITEAAKIELLSYLPFAHKNATAHKFMIKYGAKYEKASQTYYTDSHESAKATEDKNNRYLKKFAVYYMRMAVWVTVPLKDATEAALADRQRILDAAGPMYSEHPEAAVPERIPNSPEPSIKVHYSTAY
jgi:hypothetical protein